MLCSELGNWFVRPPSGERERQYTVAKVTSTSPTLDCDKGLIFWGMLEGKGMRGEPMQHSAPGFQKPVAGEQSPTSFHLNPLYPGHATRSTQLTTGPSPWLPHPPSISTLAGYQPVMLHLALLVLTAALKNHFTNLRFHDS